MWTNDYRSTEFYAWVFLALVASLLGLVIISAKDSINAKMEHQVTEWCSSEGVSYLAYKSTLLLQVDDNGLPVLCGEPNDLEPRGFITE